MQISLSKKVAGFVGALALACGGAVQAQPTLPAGNGETIPLKKPVSQLIETPSVVSPETFSGGTPTNPEVNVGIGFYFIKPYWESNAAFTKSVSTTVGTVTTTNTQTREFTYSNELAPRVFAEYIGESGLGARVGWWHYDQRSAAAAAALPSPIGGPFTSVSGTSVDAGFFPALAAGQTDIFTLGNRVVFDVWDFDITQRLITNDLWQLTGGGGVRYGYLSQTYDAVRIRSGLPAGLVNTAEFHARNMFNVAGPDFLLEAKRALGNGGFALYGNGRAGVLFGTSRFSSTAISTIAVIPGPPTVGVANSLSDRNNDVVPFLETELGVEWHGCGRGAQPFMRLGVVGQSWWGVGNGRSSGADANMGFFGGTVVAGFSF